MKKFLLLLCLIGCDSSEKSFQKYNIIQIKLVKQSFLTLSHYELTLKRNDRIKVVKYNTGVPIKSTSENSYFIDNGRWGNEIYLKSQDELILE